MERLTLFLGGSAHGQRLPVDGEPAVYQHKLPQDKVQPAKLNGCNATAPRRKGPVEEYRRVWVEAAGLAVYVLDGYELGEEDAGLVG